MRGRLAGFHRGNPRIDPRFQHVQRQRAAVEDLVVEGADIELTAQLLFRALAAAKTALNRGLDSTFLAELEATLEQQTACFATRDFAEGVEALAAKRPPRFTGA